MSPRGLWSRSALERFGPATGEPPGAVLPPQIVVVPPGQQRSEAPIRPFVGANAVQLERLFDDLVALARSARLPDGSVAIAHEDVQAQLAQARSRVEEVKLIVRDTVERILVDDEHPSDGPVAKLAYTELDVALCELALEITGSSASIDEGGLAVADRSYHNFLWSRALTISGGSSEIMRGLIGRQLLGLPRA